MKLRFHLNGLSVAIDFLPQRLQITVMASNSPVESQSVSPLLKQRINACKTMRELLELLFSTPDKTEAEMALFDQKLEALEQEGFSISKTFKSNDNGSASSQSIA